MSVRRFLIFLGTSLLAALVLFLPGVSQAHGPFDHNVRVWVFEDHLEVTVTLGPEAAKPFLNNGPSEVLYAGHMESAFPLPPASAARIFEIKSGDTVLKPLRSDVRSDGLEYNFGLFYPRPDNATLGFGANYMSEIAMLTRGAIIIMDENGSALAARVLSADTREIQLTLPAKVGANPVPKNEPKATFTNSAIAPPPTAPLPNSKVNLPQRSSRRFVGGGLVTLVLIIGCVLRSRQRSHGSS